MGGNRPGIGAPSNGAPSRWLRPLLATVLVGAVSGVLYLLPTGDPAAESFAVGLTGSRATEPPVAAGDLTFGYAVHYGAETFAEDLRRAKRGGATTVRLDLHWRHIEPARGELVWHVYDDMMEKTAAAGLRPLLLVGTSPAWASGVEGGEGWYPPRRAEDYGEFVGRVARRYGKGGTFWQSRPELTRVPLAGIEVWNEPNLNWYWRSGADPAKYTAMVRSAYRKAKAVDPAVPVVVGSFAPVGGSDDGNCDGKPDGGRSTQGANAIDFLREMYRLGAAGSFDVLSHHPYNFHDRATAEEALSYHPCSAWSQLTETKPNLRSVMAANGDAAKPVWATEFGVPTCRERATFVCMTEEEHADLATAALEKWQAWDWAGDLYWFQIRDGAHGVRGGSEGHFGVLRRDGSRKPAYDRIRQAVTR